MFEIVFKIWYLIAILPMIIFTEGNKMLGGFLKRKKIYAYWDVWHGWIVVVLIVFIILWLKGYRF